MSENPYALNETIRILIRTIVPFVIFILVALIWPREPNQQVVRFFIKMKTKVITNQKEDKEALSQAYINPEHANKLNLFPKSYWEFERWDKEDASGFIISIGIVILLVGFMMLIVSIGA